MQIKIFRGDELYGTVSTKGNDLAIAGPEGFEGFVLELAANYDSNQDFLKSLPKRLKSFIHAEVDSK